MQVSDQPELRPTPGRVRETLFNWLTGKLAGAHVLDAFAGTGALGFEALSRGAARVVFAETNSKLTDQIEATAQLWGETDAVQVFTGDVLTYLAGQPDRFNLVLLDPPFAADCLPATLLALQHAVALTDQALVYVERGEDPASLLPRGWTSLRQKCAGDVHFALWQVDS